MTHYPNPSMSVDAVIAAACLALLTLTLILFLLCKKNHTVDPDNDRGAPAILPAQSHPLSDIDAATDGFHPSLMHGKGHLGTIYKATSTTGELFVVKRIHPHLILSNVGPGFSSKIKSLSFANHLNVVPILGYSEAPGERIIITEFVKMRSLDSYLHESSVPRLLDWGLRLRIAAGAARGIEHLHEGIAPGIVHGRVKPSNILIDVNFCARVCDYGLSFLSPGDNRELVGYSDGEGREEGCKANDVYGLGVVLLEILSGRRCEGGLIVDWALPLIRGGRIGEVVDTRIGLAKDMRPLVRMAKVALACVGNARKSRPSIGQVAAILSSLEMCCTPS